MREREAAGHLEKDEISVVRAPASKQSDERSLKLLVTNLPTHLYTFELNQSSGVQDHPMVSLFNKGDYFCIFLTRKSLG